MKNNSDFSFTELFSQTFKPHSEEEMESYWGVGAIGTIPSLQEIQKESPRPWMFIRILGLSLCTYFLLLFCWSKFHNLNCLPGIMITGCAIVPLSVLFFFFEMNIRRNISMYMVAKMTILGGALSLVYALLLSLVAYIFRLNLDSFGAGSAGFVEEIAKLLAVMLIVNRKRYPYILNGMLFGAAVGTGFSIYESAGYAFHAFLGPVMKYSIEHSAEISAVCSNGTANVAQTLNQLITEIASALDSNMLFNINIRGLLSPFDHIIWTALVGGAVWQVKGNRAFRLKMFCDIRFIVIMVSSILMHFAWNSSWNFSIITKNWDKYILLGIIGWMLVLWMFRVGLRQIAEQKEASDNESCLNEILLMQRKHVECMLTTSSQTSPEYDCPIHGSTGHSATAEDPALHQEKLPLQNPIMLQKDDQEAKQQEENRQLSNHSDRSWRKYYSK